MKNSGKIILTVLAAFSFFGVIFWKGVYYIGGMSHLYYSNDVVNSIYYYIAISIFAIALFTMLVIVILIIAGFTYYTSVAQGEKFKPRFLEMSAISITVAVVSFFVGILAKKFLGVDL